jgi:hypothetical protein
VKVSPSVKAVNGHGLADRTGTAYITNASEQKMTDSAKRMEFGNNDRGEVPQARELKVFWARV